MGGWFCIVAIGNAVGAWTPVRYQVGVHYWECPLTEVPLYTCSQLLLLTNESQVD